MINRLFRCYTEAANGFMLILEFTEKMKRSQSDVNVDWNLCCICQKSDKDKLHSTESGLKSLSDNLCEFYVLNGLKFDVARISTTTVNGIINTCETLSADSAKFHHNCAARYNERELEALALVVPGYFRE